MLHSHRSGSMRHQFPKAAPEVVVAPVANLAEAAVTVEETEEAPEGGGDGGGDGGG